MMGVSSPQNLLRRTGTFDHPERLVTLGGGPLDSSAASDSRSPCFALVSMPTSTNGASGCWHS